MKTDFTVAPALNLHIACDHGLQRVLVEATGLESARCAVYPFTMFLAHRPVWAGGERWQLRIGYPDAVRDAFRPGTFVRDAIRTFEWHARTRSALTARLRELAALAPELPFT